MVGFVLNHSIPLLGFAKVNLPMYQAHFKEQINETNLHICMITPPIAEILSVKNGRAIVVCGFFMK